MAHFCERFGCTSNAGCDVVFVASNWTNDGARGGPNFSGFIGEIRLNTGFNVLTDDNNSARCEVWDMSTPNPSFIELQQGVEQRMGVRCRLTDASNYYAADIIVDGSGDYTLRLYKVVAGTRTILGSAAVAYIDGAIVKVKASGSTISASYNRVELLSVIDGSLTTGTSAGAIGSHFQSYGSPGPPRIDNLFMADEADETVNTCPALPGSPSWTMREVARVGTVHWAVGRARIDDALIADTREYHVLRRPSGTATVFASVGSSNFTRHDGADQLTSLVTIDAFPGQVVLMGADVFEGRARMYRLQNGAAIPAAGAGGFGVVTFDPVDPALESGWVALTLPQSGYAATTRSIVRCVRVVPGTDRAVACGADGDATTQFRTWFAPDRGKTWQETSAGVVSPPTGATQGAGAVLPLDATRVLLALTGEIGVDLPQSYFRMSLDGGLTYPLICPMLSPAPSGVVSVEAMITTRQGSVLAFLNSTPPQIWRGRSNGLVVDFHKVFEAPAGDVYHGVGFSGAEDGILFDAGGCQSVGGRTREGACVDELTDDDIIGQQGRWISGDRLVINRVIFSIDWDALNDIFTKHVVYSFAASIKKFGLRPALKIPSQGIRSSPVLCAGVIGNVPVGCGIAQLDERAFNIGARFADPPQVLELECFYRKHTWEVGDVICVSSSFIPNRVLGRRELDHEAFEIINIRSEFAPQGKLVLTLLDVEAITLPETGTVDRHIAEDLTALLVAEGNVASAAGATTKAARVAGTTGIAHGSLGWSRGHGRHRNMAHARRPDFYA